MALTIIHTQTSQITQITQITINFTTLKIQTAQMDCNFMSNHAQTRIENSTTY